MNESISACCNALQQADAILVGAGAGLSSAAGFTYIAINLGEASAPRKLHNRSFLYNADVAEVLSLMLSHCSGSPN